jgi:membrane protein YdbS with pleckstrin-like domain
MKLSDPFGRHNKKQESNYSSFRQSLKDANIDSQEKAKKLLNSTRQRILISALITIASVGATKLLFPAQTTMVAIFAGVILLWLLASIFNSQLYIRRYMEEEFKKDPE